MVWAIGPATYACAFAYCSAWPEMCSDPPNLQLGCLLAFTHAVAGLMTVPLVFRRGSHQRQTIFWLIVTYWSGIAAWLALPLGMLLVLGEDPETQRIASAVGLAGTRIAAAAAVLAPLTELVSRWIRTTQKPVRE